MTCSALFQQRPVPGAVDQRDAPTETVIGFVAAAQDAPAKPEESAENNRRISRNAGTAGVDADGLDM
jgi:hypothetical protein